MGGHRCRRCLAPLAVVAQAKRARLSKVNLHSEREVAQTQMVCTGRRRLSPRPRPLTRCHNRQLMVGRRRVAVAVQVLPDKERSQVLRAMALALTQRAVTLTKIALPFPSETL